MNWKHLFVRTNGGRQWKDWNFHNLKLDELSFQCCFQLQCFQCRTLLQSGCFNRYCKRFQCSCQCYKCYRKCFQCQCFPCCRKCFKLQHCSLYGLEPAVSMNQKIHHSTGSGDGGACPWPRGPVALRLSYTTKLLHLIRMERYVLYVGAVAHCGRTREPPKPATKFESRQQGRKLFNSTNSSTSRRDALARAESKQW